ncbi:MAG TPA: formyltransferase family protein [Solirubrobacteraceae bacterium]|nr:formyltransferase family protein [Solirubrobacteraceae bacterium]
MQLTIALAAEEAAGVQALRLLAHHGHHVAAVFTSTGEDGQSASVASAAASLGMPVHPAAHVCDPAAASTLRERGVDLLLSVHCRHLIHADLLAAPAVGAYNLHPGLLPECAGLNTPSWALYEGAASHGVTLHHMTPIFDAGPIVFAEKFDLGAADTGLAVLMQCVRRGLVLVQRLLALLEAGDAVPAEPQDLSRRRWFEAGPPDDGLLDWRRPARSVVNFVRACDFDPFPSPWGFPRCVARGLNVAVLDAVVAEPCDARPGTIAHADGAALIAAADAWVKVKAVELEQERLPAVEVLREGERLALLGRERAVGVAP